MRAVREWIHTLVSLNGTPHGIAAGFSLGVGLSLIPIPFLGMLTALALAPALRCNLVATYLGSAVVNPVTGPFIYFAELWVGLWLTKRPLPQWSEVQSLSATQWWDLFTDLAGPFLAGATTTMIGVAAVSYPLLWWASGRWQAGQSELAANEPSTNKGAAVGLPGPTTAPSNGSIAKD